jgi:hypothetical protein
MNQGSISIYFNRFWDGFIEGTDPVSVSFFVELFTRVFNTRIVIERNIDNASILCENACRIHDSAMNKKSWIHSILFTGESVVSFGNLTDSHYSHFSQFSCFLSGLATNKNLKRIQCPLFISYLFCNPDKSMVPVDSVPKERACAVIGNPKGKVRNKFLDKLETVTSISYGGRFRCNIEQPLAGHYHSATIFDFMKKHQFVITMENNEEDYYITEKICNGFFAGVIPIYWGSPHIAEYIHQDRFLHLKNDSDEECERIIQQIMSMDDELYLKIVHSPILKNNVDTMIQHIAEDIKSMLGYTNDNIIE